MARKLHSKHEKGVKMDCGGQFQIYNSKFEIELSMARVGVIGPCWMAHKSGLTRRYSRLFFPNWLPQTPRTWGILIQSDYD
jgi:hypothetical protein